MTTTTTVTLSVSAVLAFLGADRRAMPEYDNWIHSKAQRLPFDTMGPFATLADGRVLAVDAAEVLTSADDGKTWQKQPLFGDAGTFLARPERALVRTREGVLVMGFLNERELRRGKWDLNDRKALEGFFLPTYVTRSLDDGKTWEPPTKVQDGWCGAIRCLIQLKSGRLVLAGQQLIYDPGRHVVLTYVSDDVGKTWKASNTIDLGGAGSHAGAMEGTLAELADGRLLMLIRTTLGWFHEATSTDGGLTWKNVRSSGIESSTCCGTLARLASGRIVLLWNRSPEGEAYSLNSRAELSMAFSDDEMKTWSKPVVIARRPLKPGEKYYAARQSYPYVYERRPGELWITTMQGKLRMKLNEADFPPGAERTKGVRRFTIVALGSSTTARRGGIRQVYAERLNELLPAAGLPARIINSGVGSDTTELARKRFDRDVLAHEPDLVIIQLGLNDAAVDVWRKPPATQPRVALERYADNFRWFVRTLKARKTPVILMTPNPLRWTPKLVGLYGKPPYDANDPDGFNLLLVRYVDAVRAVAREEQVPLVDVFKAYQDHGKVDDLLLDGMHPNDAGHELTAGLLLVEIRTVVARTAKPAAPKE